MAGKAKTEKKSAPAEAEAETQPPTAAHSSFAANFRILICRFLLLIICMAVMLVIYSQYTENPNSKSGDELQVSSDFSGNVSGNVSRNASQHDSGNASQYASGTSSDSRFYEVGKPSVENHTESNVFRTVSDGSESVSENPGTVSENPDSASGNLAASSDMNSSSGTDSSSGMNSGSDTDSSSGMNSGSGTDSSSGMNSGSGTDSSSGMNSGNGTDSSYGMNSGSGTDSSYGMNSGSGTDSSSGMNSGSGTDSSSPLPPSSAPLKEFPSADGTGTVPPPSPEPVYNTNTTITGPDGRPRRGEVAIHEVGLTPRLKSPAGPPVDNFLEVFNFEATPEWVEERWSSITVVGPLYTRGYRVPLSTGPLASDLVGSLTYYFNNHLEVEKITFEGYTGELDRLVMTLKYFNMSKRITTDPNAEMYASETLSDNRQSFMKTYHRVTPIDENNPNRKYWLTIELYPPER